MEEMHLNFVIHLENEVPEYKGHVPSPSPWPQA